MAEDDRPQDQPSLELPSFSLRRLRRARPRSAEAEAPAKPPAEPPAAPPAEATVTETRPVAEEPAPAPAPVAVREPIEQPIEQPVEQSSGEPAAVRPAAAIPAPRTRQVRRPGGLLAATLTGLVAGLGLVGLTWAALRSCGAVRGTTSCGGGVGYPLVALIFVAMVVVATVLLRLARVPEPTGTSLLGLGLAGVIALLFLVDVLLDGSMVVVIPLITAGTFALSYWVTNNLAAPADD